MELFKKCILISLFVFSCICTGAQENELRNWSDSVVSTITQPVKVHLPRKATIYSAVLPGLGQIYNHQWWKVPFIYGGFGTLGYVVNYFNQKQVLYLQSYWDIVDGDPLTHAYYDIPNFDKGVDESDAANVTDIKDNQFKPWIKYYSRQRNLYLIVTAGFYLINVLDANVNAHFLDFDISEDLSLNLSPITVDPLTNRPVPGMTLVFNF